MKIQTAVALKVAQLLSKHKITEYQLAKRMATSQSTIQHILNDEYKSIKFDTLMKIADAFSITIQQFLNDDLFNKENLDY